MTQEPRKYDVVVVGELNVDLILNGMDTFPKTGKEIFARQMHLTLGSSAAILASNLSSLGAKVVFLGQVGNDIFGQLVLSSLETAGVDTRYIVVNNKVVTGASIGLQHNNDRAMVTYAGAMESFQYSSLPLEVLNDAQHLHFSSYFFQPGMQMHLAQLFQLARLKGLTTSFDMQSDPNDQWDMNYASILPHADLFFPNEEELLLLTRKDNLADAIEEISQYANAVAIKRGIKGSIVVHNNTSIEHPGYSSPEVVDAIGAGDSFNAGFIFEYLRNKRVETCQDFANKTGAWSTTAPGGTTAFVNIKNAAKYVRNQFSHTKAASP